MTDGDPPIDPRRFAPATERNRLPILDRLLAWLPRRGLILEVASGTGEHAVFFARHFEAAIWQPSDLDAAARASITAWTRAAGLTNICPPLRLDTSSPDWPIERADAIVAINLVHIAPWDATLGLLAGAARCLGAGAPLILYGPYRRAGIATAASNQAFDENLRRQNPAWGLRDLDALLGAAETAGLAVGDIVDMPANNLMIRLHKPASSDRSGTQAGAGPSGSGDPKSR